MVHMAWGTNVVKKVLVLSKGKIPFLWVRESEKNFVVKLGHHIVNYIVFSSGVFF